MNVPRRALVGLVVAVALAGAVLVSPDAVLGRIEALAADPLAFGVALGALYLVRPFLAVPTLLCSVAVGYAYGVYGFPVALAGTAFTSLPPFFLTRWALNRDGSGNGDDRGTRSGPLGWVLWSADRVRQVGREYFSTAGGIRGVTAARLAPIPADLVTCGAAATGVSTRALVVGTVVGETPWTVAGVLVGTSAGSLVGVGGLTDLGLPVVAAGLGVAAALLAGPAYRRLRGQRTRK